MVISVATAGDRLQWHPHLHLIATDGGRTKDGSWCELAEGDAVRLMELFRERLLAKLVEERASQGVGHQDHRLPAPRLLRPRGRANAPRTSSASVTPPPAHETLIARLQDEGRILVRAAAAGGQWLVPTLSGLAVADGLAAAFDLSLPN